MLLQRRGLIAPHQGMGILADWLLLSTDRINFPFFPDATPLDSDTSEAIDHWCKSTEKLAKTLDTLFPPPESTK